MRLTERKSGCPKGRYSGSNSWNFKHGDYKSPEYYSWSGAKGRCRNSRNKDYSKYGGRGIKFCERWDNYKVFLADMGRKPSPDCSLDRINVNGDYCPDNCRWATTMEQNHNRRIFWINATDLQEMKDRLQKYNELYGPLPL